jgi:histidinol phosphatase-like enzyme
MGLIAQEQFTEIDFHKSIIAGNSLSDMEFGIALGMKTVFIDDKKALKGVRLEQMDHLYESLHEFAEALTAEVR